MQFHHGNKLKKLIEDSGMKVSDIVEKTGIHRTTLYNYFDYEEIPRKKIAPILELLDEDINLFYNRRYIENNASSGDELTAFKNRIKDLEDIIKAKDELIVQLREMNEMLKAKLSRKK